MLAQDRGQHLLGTAWTFCSKSKDTLTAEGQDPQCPAGTAQPKGHNGHTTPKSMENREEPQQGGERPIWQQLWTRLKSIFDTQELL